MMRSERFDRVNELNAENERLRACVAELEEQAAQNREDCKIVHSLDDDFIEALDMSCRNLRRKLAEARGALFVARDRFRKLGFRVHPVLIQTAQVIDERDDLRDRVAELESERDRYKEMYESTEKEIRKWEQDAYRAGTGEN